MVTLLASLALCMLYACRHMTVPGTESQAQLSEQGLSPSAGHAHGCALKNLSVLVAPAVQTAMLQMMWQEGWASLKDALCVKQLQCAEASLFTCFCGGESATSERAYSEALCNDKGSKL